MTQFPKFSMMSRTENSSEYSFTLIQDNLYLLMKSDDLHRKNICLVSGYHPKQNVLALRVPYPRQGWIAALPGTWSSIRDEGSCQHSSRARIEY
jgi:hypothetical protein